MKIRTILTVVLALLFLGFCIPKLTASDVSLALFNKINEYTGFQGRWFMYVTGLIELSVGLLLAASLLSHPLQPKLRMLGLLAAIGTMCGALFTELGIRPGEDPALTILATVMLALAGYLVWPMRNDLLTLIPGFKPAK
jgi:hypothetical protein